VVSLGGDAAPFCFRSGGRSHGALAWECSSFHRKLKVLTCCCRLRHAFSTRPRVIEASAPALRGPKVKVTREMTRREVALLAEDVRQTGVVVIGWSPEGLERKLSDTAGELPRWVVWPENG